MQDTPGWQHRKEDEFQRAYEYYQSKDAVKKAERDLEEAEKELETAKATREALDEASDWPGRELGEAMCALTGSSACKGADGYRKELDERVKNAERRVDDARHQLWQRKQVFKKYATKKRAKDARPRPQPQKPKAERSNSSGGKEYTRQKKNKKGMGQQGGEKHDRGGRHFHDDRHNNDVKPNVHYEYPD